MWVLVITFLLGSGSSITSVEMGTSKERCVEAVKFSKERRGVYDAWCVQK